MFLVQFVVSLRMSDEDMEINDEALRTKKLMLFGVKVKNLIN